MPRITLSPDHCRQRVELLERFLEQLNVVYRRPEDAADCQSAARFVTRNLVAVPTNSVGRRHRLFGNSGATRALGGLITQAGFRWRPIPLLLRMAECGWSHDLETSQVSNSTWHPSLGGTAVCLNDLQPKFLRLAVVPDKTSDQESALDRVADVIGWVWVGRSVASLALRSSSKSIVSSASSNVRNASPSQSPLHLARVLCRSRARLSVWPRSS